MGTAGGSGKRARGAAGWWWSPDRDPPETFEAVGLLDVPRVGPADVTRLMARLRGSGGTLRTRAVRDIAETLGRTGERILDSELDDLCPQVAAEASLSEAMARRVVVGMAGGWTRSALSRLLESEFPDPGVLDGFRQVGGRMLHARGLGLTLHLGAGSVPGVGTTSLIRALLVKSPSLVKPGSGDVTLVVGFLRLLWEEDPELAACAAALYWRGGAEESRLLEDRAFQEADQVVVYGGWEVTERVRKSVPAHVRVVSHGPRVGVVVAGRDTSPEAVADAAAVFDQRGCVSPQVVLFLGTMEATAAWARRLHGALSDVAVEYPPGPVDPALASRLHQLRGALELRAAGGEEVLVLGGGGSSTVVVAGLVDVEPLGGRTVWIVPCRDRSALDRGLEAMGPVLQSVGVDEPALREIVAVRAAAAGASRIVPVRELAFPPAEWLHDGSRPLVELTRWAEWR